MAHHRKHPYSHTHVEHHKDGSMTVHHQHESDTSQDMKHAVPDLDSLHDSMEEHLGEPNADEGEQMQVAEGGGLE